MYIPTSSSFQRKDPIKETWVPQRKIQVLRFWQVPVPEATKADQAEVSDPQEHEGALRACPKPTGAPHMEVEAAVDIDIQI